MSIYATLGRIWLELDWNDDPREVVFQGVPGHIGHPEEYDDDIYADFLPPPVENMNDLRAVVVIDQRWNRKEGQRYLSPLLVLTGKEWGEMPWSELWSKIMDRISDFEAYGEEAQP